MGDMRQLRAARYGGKGCAQTARAVHVGDDDAAEAERRHDIADILGIVQGGNHADGIDALDVAQCGKGAGGAGVQGIETVSFHDRQKVWRIGAAAEQAQAAIGAREICSAAEQGRGMENFRGNGAFAGAGRADQQDAARLFEIDRRG